MKTQELNRTDPKTQLEVEASRDPKKWEVAQQFEAMFVQQMFQAMRKTVPESGLTEESNGRRIFTDMLDQEMSTQASHQQSLGLADLIYRQLVQDGTDSIKTKLPSQSGISAYNSASRSSRASSQQVDAWIQEAASSQQLDPALLKSLVQQESGGDSLAVSAKGAMGLTQLMKGTAEEVGVENPWDGRQNVMGGARYLKKLLQRFDGREDLAVAAYNAGPAAVEKYGGVPPFAETRQYVKKVLDGRKSKDTEVDYGT